MRQSRAEEDIKRMIAQKFDKEINDDDGPPFLVHN